MASEDVIELGSSDDEAEPAPKKVKQSSRPKPKPKPNAMVHIPGKLHGVTIKPTSVTKSTLPKISGLQGKPIMKVNPTNQFLNKAKVNGKPPMKVLPANPNIFAKKFAKPIQIESSPKVGLNPMTLMKKLNSSQVMINKVPSNPKLIKHPVLVHKVQNPKCLIQVQSPRTINNLPPSITIKRTAGGPSAKRSAIATTSNLNKKQKIMPKGSVGDVLTVELDDDDTTSATTSSPQWYLRPEEQTDPLEVEAANNEEPEISKYIEITIEDSPVKPTSSKRVCEVGTELAITIDDSPVKHIKAKPSTSAHSDDETPENNEPPHSKKKLEYPKETETKTITKTIEVEIEPITIGDLPKEDANEHVEEEVSVVSETIVDLDTPVKTPNISTSTPKKEDTRPTIKLKELDTEKVNNTDTGEFHSTYQTFIDLCLKLEDSDDMKKIVEKKIKAYYKQVPKEYTESEEFIDMVSSKIISIKAGPEKMYLYIKDIVDELNLQRKMAKTQPILNKETKSAEAEKFTFGEDSEFDSKRQRQIRKLEKTLKKLHRAIQKLEEQEVDFDDEEDSVYLLTESDDGSSSSKDIEKQLEKNRNDLLKRYKERMVRVHAKFCQLTNTKMPSEPRVQIDARPGLPSGPAKRLEKWVNKKVPVGTPLPFPDFHDVLRCVREANDEDKLGWNEADIMEEARDLFTRCGKKLQRRRQENEWRSAASRIAVDIDPAEKSEDLKKKLEDNKKVATKKETEVFNKYADRQSLLKLEAVEIGDKEADESPVESEDDEPVEETSTLEDKEKRKQRIRRIINEKSKKINDEPKKSQDNQSDVVSEDVNKDEGCLTEAKSDKQKEELEVMEIDASASKGDENKINRQPQKVNAVHSISDDSNQMGSDVDELHLLQKLHSGNEINSSTLDSSDTDSPINISDTLQSSSDNKKKQTSDVISIENSSLSESDVNKDTNNPKEDKTDRPVLEAIAEEAMEETVEENVEAVTPSPKKRTDQTNNDEYNESVENILLASSDDEPEENKDASPVSNEACVNIKDDSISIGDTVVESVNKDNNETNTHNNNVDEDVRDLKDAAQNDDSSQEIIFISQEDKEEEQVTLTSAAISDKNTDLSSFSSNPVQPTEVCETTDITNANDVENTVSKTIANSEATKICDITNTEVDDSKSSKSKKENTDCEKRNISNTFEASSDINNEVTSEVQEITQPLIDKDDVLVEDNAGSTDNDKQETIDILIREIRSDMDINNKITEPLVEKDNVLLEDNARSTDNDKQETIDIIISEIRSDMDINNEISGPLVDKDNVLVEDNAGSTDNDKQETVDILISEIRSDLDSIEPLEVPASILQNNEL